jgi:predicted RNA methylase
MINILSFSVLIFCLSTLLYHFKTGVPPYPSSKKESIAVLQLLQTTRCEAGPIYELGCGWGNLAVALAKQYPNTQIIGIEISPLPYMISLLRSLRYKNLKIIRKDFYQVHLHDASAITCYLMRAPMKKLEEKLNKELPSSTPVVSVAFYFPHITPTSIVKGQGIIQADTALYYW